MNSIKALASIALVIGLGVIAATPALAFPAFSSSRLNLRSGPGEEFPIVGVMERNVRVEMTGCLQDWSWCVVTVAGVPGWVFSKYVVVDVQGAVLQVGIAADQGRVPVVGVDGMLIDPSAGQ
jgi:uncharacterized protein YraI